MGQAIRFPDASLLRRSVQGRNLDGPTLAENLAEPALLVFLRHFG